MALGGAGSYKLATYVYERSKGNVMADEQKNEGVGEEPLQMVGDGAEPDTQIAAEGTGAVAEDQETAPDAAAADAARIDRAQAEAEAALHEMGTGGDDPAAAMPPGGSDAPAPGPESDSAADRAHVEAYLDDDETDSGVDLVVVIVVLLVVLGCLVGSLVMAMNAPKPSSSQAQTKAEQEAIAAAEAQAEEDKIPVVELPEGVAAVVNGQEIPEQQVTDYIMDFRNANGLEDEQAWGKWVVSFGYNMETLREAAINYYVTQALLDQAAEQLNVTVTEEDIDRTYQEARDGFETEEEWLAALEMSGLTEESYREQCANIALQNLIAEASAADALNNEEIDADVLEYVKSYNQDYAEATSLDEVPADVVAEAREAVEYYATQEAFSAFMTNLQDTSTIEMSKIPSDVPYNVFLLPFYFSMMMEQAQADNANGVASVADPQAEAQAQ